jgi:signal transduction histidine kinase
MSDKTETNRLESIETLRAQLAASEGTRREQAQQLARAERRIRSLEQRATPPVRGSRGESEPALSSTWSLLDEFGRDLVFFLDESAKLVRIAHAAAEALGMDETSVCGREIYDFVLEEDRPALKNYLHVSSKVQALGPLAIRCQDRQKQACEVEVVCRRLPGRSRLGRGWVGLVRPRAAAPQAVPDGPSAGELELTTGLAHELNQPLTTIGTTARACVRLLQSGQSEPAELLQAAEQIARQADRAIEIIQRLRDLITEGKRHETPTDLNALVGETMQLLIVDLNAASLAPRLRLAPDLPPVLLDRIQISQVLVNLIRNALEAMQAIPASERRLEIATEHDRNEARVLVRDHGTGLTVDMLRHLFEPFQTTKPHGMGVGLALCRNIIQAHGGRIAARPNVDRGTTFFFSLPLGKERP